MLKKCGVTILCQVSSVTFARENSYCFQRVLAIAILSTRITKSSPSAAWKTLVSGTLKLFHKFEGGHPERGR